MGEDSNANYIVRNTKTISVVFIHLLYYLTIRARLIITVSWFPWGLVGGPAAGPALVLPAPGAPSYCCWWGFLLFSSEVA